MGKCYEESASAGYTHVPRTASQSGNGVQSLGKQVGMRDGVINGLIVPAQVEEEPGHLDVDRP